MQAVPCSLSPVPCFDISNNGLPVMTLIPYVIEKSGREERAMDVYI